MICKVCGIRDFSTAYFCAREGANLLGLHAIKEIKERDLSNFLEINRNIQRLFPNVGRVLVTRNRDISDILRMFELVATSHVQLHAPWSAMSILKLRSELQERGHDAVKIIGVVTLSEDQIDQVTEISGVVDFILLDRTSYSGNKTQKLPVDHVLFGKAKSLSEPTPVLIAGGLTPRNVRDYITKIKPYGVDVQTGVEYPDKPGVKDPILVTSFLNAAKGLE